MPQLCGGTTGGAATAVMIADDSSEGDDSRMNMDAC